MRYKNDKKYQVCHHHIRFSNSKCTRIRFRQDLRPFPRRGAYDAPPDPLFGWGGGYTLPIPLPARRLRRLELGAFGASVLRPPQHKILATPVTKLQSWKMEEWENQVIFMHLSIYQPIQLGPSFL